MEHEEGGEEGEEEEVTQMATRLIRALDHQEEMLSLKRRYVQQRWPENSKKHKELGFPAERCVPESLIREEKEFSGFKQLVEKGIANLCRHGSRKKCSQLDSLIVYEPPLNRIQAMSDVEAIHHVPAILCSLNKRALKTLFYALTGRPLTTNHRYILEREIKKEFSKLVMPDDKCGLPEELVQIASVVRSPRSYRHTLESANPSVNFIPSLPKTALAAAHTVFACIKNFPTCIVVQIGKVLVSESNTDRPLAFKHKTHLQTVEAVNREVEKVFNQLRNDDPLPACLEGSLHAISLSVRILYGNDSGLDVLLKPLPAEKLVLERTFSAAYNQIEKLDDVHLLRVCQTLGKEVVWRSFKRHLCIAGLQRLMIESMHCIYAFDSFPVNVSEAIRIINNAYHEAKMKFRAGNTLIQDTVHVQRFSEARNRDERINAEIEALLNVSAAFQSVVWECYDSYERGLGMAAERASLTARNKPQASRMEADPAEAKRNHLLSTLIPELSRSTAENNHQALNTQIEIGEDGDHVAAAGFMAPRRKSIQQDIEHHAQAIESFSDEAAAFVYVIIGGLLKDTPLQQSIYMDQAGIDKLEHSSASAINISGGSIPPAFSKDHNVDKLVLDIAKQLNGIPESVISEAELRITQQFG